MRWIDWNHQNDGWKDAPWWARRLRDSQAAIILQNEAILAKLEDRSTRLSPEDQARLDQIFEIEAADKKAIDAELSKK